jgi:hypothetical protein
MESTIPKYQDTPWYQATKTVAKTTSDVSITSPVYLYKDYNNPAIMVYTKNEEEVNDLRNTTRQTLNLLHVQGFSLPITYVNGSFGENLSFIPFDHLHQSYHRPLVSCSKDGIGILGSTSELNQAPG